MIIAFIVLVAIVGVIGAIATAANTAGKASGFAALGVVTGKSFEEIKAVVGPPSSVSNIGPGEVLYQWIHTSSAGGYHYAILFRDGACVGYTHQHVS